MKHLLSGIPGMALLFATAVTAEEASSPPIKADSPAEDCSKTGLATFLAVVSSQLRQSDPRAVSNSKPTLIRNIW